jgi:hypothetical protein
MADSQIIKVVYDFDLGNAKQSTKEFTKYLRENGLALTVAKQRGKELAQSADQVADSMNRASTAAGKATNSLKQTNMQWTNLALVIQDLPYGFRGIQNNLPALVGSFAAATGPIYLGISAVIAAVTAWDMGLFKVKETTKQVKDEQDSYNESLKTSMSSAFGEISQLKALISVIENTGVSIDKRKAALRKLQDEYPEYFKNMSVEKTKIGELETATNNLTQAIIARAEANAMTSEIEKLATKRYENTKQIEANEVAILNLTNALGLYNDKREEQVIQDQFGVRRTIKTPYGKRVDEIKQLEKANSGLRTSNDSLNLSMAKLQNSINFRAPQTALLDVPQEKVTKLKKAFDVTKAIALEIAKLRAKEPEMVEPRDTSGDYAAQMFDYGYLSMNQFFRESNENFDKLKENAKKSAEALSTLGRGIMAALGPSLDALLEKGASLGETLVNALKDVLKQLIKVALAAAITVLLLSALGIVDFADFSKNFATLFKSGMGFSPQTFNPTPDASGKTPGILDTIKGSSSTINVVGKIAGGDILLASQQAQRNNESTF